MRIQKENIILRDGRSLVLRSPEVTDAQEMGRFVRAFKLKDGTYIDEIQMVKFLKK